MNPLLWTMLACETAFCPGVVGPSADRTDGGIGSTHPTTLCDLF